MQLCFVVSHSLTTVSFCLKDSSLCCIASYDALRLIFYTSHQYRIYNYIFVILSLFTQGQMFGINFHCSVVAVSTPSSHSVSTAIYQFHPGEPNRERHHNNTPCRCWLLSPQLLWFHLSALSVLRSARVSSECARFYRAQIIILRHFTAHESFSFVLCANN